MISNCPKVKIEGINITDNDYVNHGKRWNALKLIEHSKQFPVFDFPLAGFDLTRKAWDISDVDDFIYHAKRCMDTSLEHPLIFDKWGVLADGWHRIVKAILLGRTTIKAIRLESMPQEDAVEKNIKSE